jgi:hypothetical protein
MFVNDGLILESLGRFDHGKSEVKSEEDSCEESN